MSDYGKFLVAHRGYSAAYPENTLLAVESALALGACFVEVDVHLSADRIPVVIHDGNLRRTGGMDINVADHPFSHLQQLSVHEPQRFGSRFHPQRIQSLQSIADLFSRYPGRTLFVEAKRTSIARFGVETFLEAVSPAIHSIAQQCVLISFDREVLAAAKQRHLVPVGWVFENWNERPLEVIDRLQPEYVFTDHEAVPANLEMLPQGSWRWAVYTIEDAQLALQWFQKGAALVETNSFGVLLNHPALQNVC